ncbi:MAG: hypothetical protein BWY76_02456 [bacterium ADurb.Bin429]|nr:MAG: hypothetical protein BWY76_02456 [bacterium ADurb.Bin429]
MHRSQDWHALVSAADLITQQPVAHPVEGHPIGNGRMGTLVWTTSEAIELQINRVDVFAVNRHTAGAHFPGSTDYGGACARVRVAVGGQPFHAGHHFAQRLSLADARCEVRGEAVRVACWVAAEDDVLVVEVTDERESPQPIEVTLAMWRESEVTTGAHTAAYAWRGEHGRAAVVQTFREAEYFCTSAVAVSSPGNEVQMLDTASHFRTLRLPAARGMRRILISSAAAMDEQADVGGTAECILSMLASSTALSTVQARHAAWWREFWGRTSVRITSPDGHGERAARDRVLFLYHMACTSRGDWPSKWNGSLFITDGDARGWGSQFWLWTTEMLYWPLHAADASDLAEPFFEMYRRALPAMTVAARQRWNANGFFLPETMAFDGPAELPVELVDEYRQRFLHNPAGAPVSTRLEGCSGYDWHLEASTRRTDPAYAGYSWISHVASSGAELAVHAWWRYRYTGDEAWLCSHVYPFLRGVTEFYRSLARRGEDKRWHLHGTNAHEDFWGVTDSIMDLAAIRGTVPLAIRASEILDADADLRAQWKAFLTELTPYPLGADPRAKVLAGAVLADDAWAAGYKGAVDGSHNVEDVQLTPIFPFEDWTLETGDAAMDAVAQRTLALAPRHRAVLDGNGLNTAIRSPIAAVRAGAGEELPAILDRYRAAFLPLPNGFSLFEQVTQGYQAHSIEHLGLLTMVMQEALLQSVSPRPSEPEVIRVFPAWPHAWDAEFRLLARGGFLVTAAIRGGEIQAVGIESRRGEDCRIRNPWPGACRVETADGSPCPLRSDDSMLCFPTVRGGAYRLIRTESDHA